MRARVKWHHKVFPNVRVINPGATGQAFLLELGASIPTSYAVVEATDNDSATNLILAHPEYKWMHEVEYEYPEDIIVAYRDRNFNVQIDYIVNGKLCNPATYFAKSR